MYPELVSEFVRGIDKNLRKNKSKSQKSCAQKSRKIGGARAKKQHAKLTPKHITCLPLILSMA